MTNCKYLLSLILFLSLSQFGWAQDFGLAIDLTYKQDEENKIVHKALLDRLIKYPISNSVLYTKKDARLTILDPEKFPEKPSKKIVFVEQKINASDKYKPVIKTKVDTLDIITSAYFEIFYNIDYNLKTIDVATGEIEHVVPKVALESTFKNRKVLNIDVKKYFGKNKKSKLNSKWSAITKLIYKDYKDKIINTRNGIRNNKLENVRDIRSAIKSAFNKDIYTAIRNEKEDGKYKTVTIDYTEKTQLEKNNILWLYTLINVADKEMAKKVTYVEIESVDQNSAIAGKTFLQGKKKFSEKLETADKFFAVYDKDLASQIIKTKEDQKINIALDVKTDQRTKYEKNMLKLPRVRLIERGYKNELNYLRNLYKEEKFIDYDLAQLQDKLQGVEYLITLENKSVSVSEVSTGQQYAIDKNQGKRGWFNPGYSTIQALNMALIEITDSPIEYLEVEKQKKDKVHSIRLYHPIGFSRGDKFDVSIFKEESVGGKTFQRKEFIASGYIDFDEDNPNLGVLKFKKKWRKDVAKAIESNQSLDFIYSIKRD